MVIRLMRRFWCSGHRGVAATIATQFGFAMMPRVPAHGAGVDLGHHQRYVEIHAERRGVVDDHRAGANRGRREALRLCTTGGEQRDVHALEAGIGQFLDRDIAAAEFHRFTDRTRRGQQAQLHQREFALLEALHELDAHGTGGAGNGDDGILEVTFGLIVR